MSESRSSVDDGESESMTSGSRVCGRFSQRRESGCFLHTAGKAAPSGWTVNAWGPALWWKDCRTQCIGWEQPNFDTAFLAGAKEVKEGELSKAVKSSFGYHFIKVQGIKEEQVKSLDDVKAQITTTLENKQKDAYYTAKLEEWTKAAKIEKFEDRIQ